MKEGLAKAKVNIRTPKRKMWPAMLTQVRGNTDHTLFYFCPRVNYMVYYAKEVYFMKAFYTVKIVFSIKQICSTIHTLLFVLINTPLNMIYSLYCKGQTFDEWFDDYEKRHSSHREES